MIDSPSVFSQLTAIARTNIQRATEEEERINQRLRKFWPVAITAALKGEHKVMLAPSSIDPFHKITDFCGFSSEILKRNTEQLNNLTTSIDCCNTEINKQLDNLVSKIPELRKLINYLEQGDSDLLSIYINHNHKNNTLSKTDDFIQFIEKNVVNKNQIIEYKELLRHVLSEVWHYSEVKRKLELQIEPIRVINEKIPADFDEVLIVSWQNAMPEYQYGNDISAQKLNWISTRWQDYEKTIALLMARDAGSGLDFSEFVFKQTDEGIWQMTFEAVLAESVPDEFSSEYEYINNIDDIHPLAVVEMLSLQGFRVQVFSPTQFKARKRVGLDEKQSDDGFTEIGPNVEKISVCEQVHVRVTW